MERNTIAEMRQVLDAIEQGKPIQCYDTHYADWYDVANNKNPNFSDYLYRVKPEEPKKKGRPFTSAEELDKAIAEHGPFIRNVDTGIRVIIDAYNGKEVRVLGMERPMEELARNYTFADGTPCGVLEDAQCTAAKK